MSTAAPRRGSIVLRGVTKGFRAYHARSVKETLIRITRRQPLTERRPVLMGVDLEVAPGERLGILGRNGAGKSTLFRIISNILHADRGTVEVTGRVSPLIEVTAGIVIDMTGRENIGLVAALLGLSRRQVAERFDTIVDFAGIRDFLDTPARYYSSGMQARLGFSVGVHVDADILLVDEALAVGDAEFQAKCIAKMEELSELGVTIIVVSHDERLVRSFAPRVVTIADGRIVA
ncbi:MAG: ABC transporter ATP-binding protein [Deltaproteobacteria bacterium]|nr:ABC transporter ATP-binding protein [Deltaproteobacteria bacterium]